jgi:hypothetical protein
MVCLNVSSQKTHEKKIVPSFRIEIIRILMAADLVLQIGSMHTFFRESTSKPITRLCI